MTTRVLTKSKQIGYSSIDFQYTIGEGEIGDTKVIINDQLLIVIAGNTIDEFLNKLQELVNLYRI